MGLAAPQITFLMLTSRKADCEYNISMASLDKMALTREMADLSNEYYSELQSKNISYYHNGKYNKMNYEYLMGYGSNYTALWNQDRNALKSDNSMILTDYTGRVVLSDSYASAIKSVLGTSIQGNDGRGGTFSTEKIAEIMSALFPDFEAESFQAVIDEKELNSSYNAMGVNTLSGKSTGETKVIDNSSTFTDKVKSLVDFYYPIFASAAANGWTTEYNKNMQSNENYVSDAIISGTFHLATAKNTGEYDEQTSLNYFITSGLVESRNDSNVREEATARYNAKKEELAMKESMLDLRLDELSTELESINTMMESVKSFIDDATSSIFDWGSG